MRVRPEVVRDYRNLLVRLPGLEWCPWLKMVTVAIHLPAISLVNSAILLLVCKQSKKRRHAGAFLKGGRK